MNGHGKDQNDFEWRQQQLPKENTFSRILTAREVKPACQSISFYQSSLLPYDTLSDLSVFRYGSVKLSIVYFQNCRLLKFNENMYQEKATLRLLKYLLCLSLPTFAYRRYRLVRGQRKLNSFVLWFLFHCEGQIIIKHYVQKEKHYLDDQKYQGKVSKTCKS